MVTTRGRSLMVLAVVALAPLACGGDGGGDDQAPASTSEGAAAAVAVADPATIRGQIQFEGTPAPNEPIDMAEEPQCAAKHTGQPTKHTVVVNDNGTLRNVFIYIKEGLPEQDYPVSGEKPVLDQEGCIYQPHVMGVQAGQEITIRNSDPLLHNVKAVPDKNRGFNISQPQVMESTRSFPTQEVMIPVECNVHGWMQAYIGVVDHPYFAVSGEDGSFEIANLPAGSYVLEAWHEKYGTQTLNVTVGPNETAEGNFTYNASMAQTAVVPLGAPIDLHDHGHDHPPVALRE